MKIQLFFQNMADLGEIVKKIKQTNKQTNHQEKAFLKMFQFKLPVLHKTRQRQWKAEVGPAFRRSI